MARMFNPPHPGETLREDVLPALGLTVTEAARQLGITRTALSRILNGHAGISP
jgi:addiction module HigA family antidote